MDCFFHNGASGSGSQHSYHMQVESVFMTYARTFCPSATVLPWFWA